LAQVAGFITYAGYVSKDEIGLILFGRDIEMYVPPAKGKAHIHLILEKIFSAQKKDGTTNLAHLCDYLLKLRKKNAMIFLLSDFITQDFEKKCAIAARMYDLVAVRMMDTFERAFTIKGLITVADPETKQISIIDARRSKGHSLNNFLQHRIEKQNEIFSHHRIDLLEISDQVPVLDQLITFFKRRSLR